MQNAEPIGRAGIAIDAISVSRGRRSRQEFCAFASLHLRHRPGRLIEEARNNALCVEVACVSDAGLLSREPAPIRVQPGLEMAVAYRCARSGSRRYANPSQPRRARRYGAGGPRACIAV